MNSPCRGRVAENAEAIAQRMRLIDIPNLFIVFFLNGYYLKAKVVLFCFFCKWNPVGKLYKKRGILTDTPRLKL